MDRQRRDVLAALSAAGIAAVLPGRAPAATLGPPLPFSWTAVQAQAKALAARPFVAASPVAGADAIGFDAAGTLRYRAGETLAGGIRLFPVTRTAPQPVAIHIVEGGKARAVAFTPDLFEAGPKAKALGLAGFRAMTPNGDSDWMAFLGGSYFRAAGSQDQYGLSARGVAIDTGIADREEFPRFTAFWIEATGPQAYVVHALLDGASVSGAFRFVCRHGSAVVQDVASVLFFRRAVARLGIAPLTSMFWYGEGERGQGADWRPEIHDSDGLAMHSGAGEAIWRPLANPARPTTHRFADRGPRGFGLLQRDRRFADYQDDGAFYDRRPNGWIEPKGDWGPGAVMLYEFPTDGETTDNVVAFWTPDAPVRAGDRLAFDYRLSWGSSDPSAAGVARAVDRWRGGAGAPGGAAIPGAQKLVVDFEGAPLAGLTRDSGVEAVADVAHGRLLAKAAYPVVGQAGRWRVTLDVAPDAGDPAEVRLFLRRGPAALSETVLIQTR